MIKKIFFAVLILNSFCAKSQNETDVLEYINRFKNYAIDEQLRSGVPAAITLAQGIHETSAGKSELATQANNHFGIKCKSNWTGETFLHDDDRKQECFRKYLDALQSYIDHSDFLRSGSRYQFLFDLDITDYFGWASGLKRAGYATNPLYVKKLTELVEKYNLQQYTYEALNKTSKKSGEVIPNRDISNPDIIEDPNLTYKGIKGFWAKNGDNMESLANARNMKLARMLELNDLETVVLPYDMFVFVEKKKKIGTVEFHLVKENENMHLISQKEAILLENLYAFNNLKKGEEPLEGEQLALQYRSYAKPKIKNLIQNENKVEITKNEVVNQIETVEEQNIVKDIKKSETKVTQTQQATTDNNIENIGNGIINAEKANKIEKIFNKENPEKFEAKANNTPKEILKVENKEIATDTKTVEEVKTPIEVKNVKKERPLAPKRTYNEPGIDDSVKILKERFDQFVYRPIEVKKKAAPVKTEVKAEITKQETKTVAKAETTNTENKTTQKAESNISTDAAKNNTKTTVGAQMKRDTLSNKNAQIEKVDTGKTNKKSPIQKTSTGVVRDTKAIEADKQKAIAEKRQANEKKQTNDIKNGKKGVKKDNEKDTKKETLAKDKKNKEAAKNTKKK